MTFELILHVFLTIVLVSVVFWTTYVLKRLDSILKAHCARTDEFLTEFQKLNADRQRMVAKHQRILQVEADAIARGEKPQ